MPERGVAFVVWLACVAGAVALVAAGAWTLAAMPQGAPRGGNILAMRGSRPVDHAR